VLLRDERDAPAATFAAGAHAPPGRVEPVRIAAGPDDLDELRRRLRSTRWLALGDAGLWRRGADLGYLRELVRYWAEDFDWSARQARLNALPNFAARVGGERVHFLHARSPHPSALPLVIAHGWPSAPAEFAGVLEALTHPTRHGALAEDAFHVIVVSLPGFLLSAPPSSSSYDIRDGAETVAALMALLGYEHYGAHGGDWGGLVAAWLSHLAPERLVGLHLTTVVAAPQPSAPLSAEERADLHRQQRFRDREMAYQALQATKPDALAVGLGDSPAGLAAWLVDKYRAWSDSDGDVERVFARDHLLELCTLYWLTGTIGASMRLFFNTRASGRVPLASGRINAPTGCAIFAHELTRPPRRWAEANYRIERWTRFPDGGHFPAVERPSALVDELRSFFRPLRP
jgi:pimeloyl-ACP methyl ester carboxylesterase